MAFPDVIVTMDDVPQKGTLDQRAEFCACIREGKPVYCDGQIGLESLDPAFAAQQSIAQGGSMVEIGELT